MHLELLQSFSFIELWHPEWIIILIFVAFLYEKAIKMKSRFQGVQDVTMNQKFYFYFGLFLFYFCDGSPVDVIGHYFLFSVHMVQQSILYMIIPPFLLLGLPGWLLRPIFRKPGVLKVFKFFTHPIISVFVFNLLLSFYHLPEIFDRIMENHNWMGLSQVILFVTSLFVWWVIVAPLPELDDMSELKKIFYVFMNGLILYPACALIIITGELVYHHYSNVPRLLDMVPVLEDQQLGGIAMKLIQEGVLATAIGVLFFRWYRKENPTEDVVLTDRAESE